MSGPSSRYRFYQYLPALKERGFQLTILPFFTHSYLDALFSGRSKGPVYLASRFLNRLGHCLGGKRYDLAWIEGDLWPFLPAFAERLLHIMLPKRRVYEFDDANWLRYEGKPLLVNKFDTILAGAAGIVVGNRFLEAHVRRVNTNTCVVPTVIDERRYANAKPDLKGCTIGWIGSPSTSFFLDDVLPALRELGKKHRLTLRVVGAEVETTGFDIDNVTWSAEQEVSLIASFDVGIMPLTATPWSEGKCGLKLIQYLATGVPAVASPVGVNSDIINQSGGGLLASDQGEWITALDTLLGDEGLRRSMGARGREWVGRHTTISAQAPRLLDFLEACARS